jgi:hypothetical protein
MPTQEVKQGSRGVRRADARAFGEGGRTMDFGMFVPWVVATKSLAGWVQLSRWPAVSNGFCFDSPPGILLLCFREARPRIALSTSDI